MGSGLPPTLGDHSPLLPEGVRGPVILWLKISTEEKQVVGPDCSHSPLEENLPALGIGPLPPSALNKKQRQGKGRSQISGHTPCLGPRKPLHPCWVVRVFLLFKGKDCLVANQEEICTPFPERETSHTTWKTDAYCIAERGQLASKLGQLSKKGELTLLQLMLAKYQLPQGRWVSNQERPLSSAQLQGNHLSKK